jgi:hypothetical protein
VTSACSKARVGTVSNAVICGANGRTTPPATPLASPHIVSGAARGTATRFAGRDTSGIEPKTGMSTGATPTCAAAVTPRTSHIHAGPGRQAAIGRASTAIPRLAPHDRRNPSGVEQERVGNEQCGGSEREHTQPVGRPTEISRDESDRRHRDRAEHGWLPARHRAEHHEQRDAGGEPTEEAETTQERGTQREDERDVLARYGGEVRESRQTESLGDVVGHASGVAEEEAGEQGPVDRRE